MAVLVVPRPLQESLGDAATESPMRVLRQVQGEQKRWRLRRPDVPTTDATTVEADREGSARPRQRGGVTAARQDA